MPILLTTPFDPGELDTGTYPRAKIIRLEIDPEYNWIKMIVQFGDQDGNDWNPGVAGHMEVLVQDTVDPPCTDYTDLVSTHTSNNGELTYVAVKRGCYEWLIANESRLAGTIE